MLLAAATLTFGAAYAQDGAEAPKTEQTADVVADDNAADTTEPTLNNEPAGNATAEPAADAKTELQGEPMHFSLMKKFLEGGWEWMLPVLVCLILGLAIAIERILYMTFAQINTKKFVANVERILNEEGVEAAKEYCRNTRGPIASIYYQGFMRYDQGLEAVEKNT